VIKEMGMRRLARFGMVVALAAGSMVAAEAQTATHTNLTVETQETGGHTVATFAVSVLDAEGAPGSGVVTLMDHGTAISSAALGQDGTAQIKVDSLSSGDHAVTAVYRGDSAHVTSTSQSVTLHPQASSTPDFSLAASPTSLTVAIGSSGTVVATIAPVNGFTGFISLSCAGPSGATTLPTGITCTFAPANLQVTSGAVTADMSLQTSAGRALNQPPSAVRPGSRDPQPVVLAVLLPGVLGLAFLGRKRKLFGRIALILLIGGVTIAGTTACNPRYYYLNHGPTYAGAIPGTYTIQVIAQTSNGVTASEHSVNVALTVSQ
jgi:hypothetical protein